MAMSDDVQVLEQWLADCCHCQTCSDVPMVLALRNVLAELERLQAIEASIAPVPPVDVEARYSRQGRDEWPEESVEPEVPKCGEECGASVRDSRGDSFNRAGTIPWTYWSSGEGSDPE